MIISSKITLIGVIILFKSFYINRSYQENTIDDIGYPGSAFDMSKLAINILTKIQQKNFDDSNNETPGLIVNSVCPGEIGLKNSFLILKLLFLIIIF